MNWTNVEFRSRVLPGDNYYFGCDELFSRHPDVVKRLIAETLLRWFLRVNLKIQSERCIIFFTSAQLSNFLVQILKGQLWVSYFNFSWGCWVPSPNLAGWFAFRLQWKSREMPIEIPIVFACFGAFVGFVDSMDQFALRIWRSRLSMKGKRRVNYFVKHLFVDEEGDFSKANVSQEDV